MGAYLGQGVYNDSQVTKEFVEEEIEKNGKGVFWVEYNVTTRAEVLQAVSDGKIIILKETNIVGAVDYATLFFKGVSASFTFVHIENERQFTIYELEANGTWTRTVKSVGLPPVTNEDNEKFLTVEDGAAKFDYLPAIKHGVETPLIFKLDTPNECVVGFNATGQDQNKKLVVDNLGNIVYKEDEFKRFGVESPLDIEESDTYTVIKWNTTQAAGMFLFARPSGDGGGVVWRYAGEEINLQYVDGAWTITNNKSWSDIIKASNYCYPVYIKMEANTDDFWYLRLSRLYDDSGTWKAEFSTTYMLTDASNKNYFHFVVVEIDSNNNVTFIDNKPAYEP